MPIEGCPRFVTYDEFEELRNQLNEAFGAREDGGVEQIFKAGAPLAGGILQSGATIYGATKLRSLEALTKITLDSPGTKAIWKELADGTAKLIGFKGNGTKAPITALNTTAKVAGQGAAGATVAATAATTAAATMAVLMSLVNIATSLGLNIATVNVIGGRIDAEIQGVQFQMDTMNATMLRLYEKHQGNIDAVEQDIASTNQRVENQQREIVSTRAEIQQADDERRKILDQVDTANEALEKLKAQNQELKNTVAETDIGIQEIADAVNSQVAEIEAKLTEATTIIENQKTTITNLQSQVNNLTVTVEALEYSQLSLGANLDHLRHEFRQLKLDLQGDPDLNDAKSKLKSAQLILLDQKARNLDLGAGSGAAASGAADSQKGILTLANNLAGQPINVPDITPAHVNSRDTTFNDTLKDLLPLIFPGTMTPEQMTELRTGISTDFEAQLKAAGLVGLGDAVVNLQDRLTPEAISSGVQKGICTSLNGGGCPIPPGNPPTIQGLGGLKNFLADNAQNIANASSVLAVAQNKEILGVVKTTKDVVTHTTYGLQKAHEYADIAWKATHADKAMNMISTVMAIHNGMMLSNNIAVTIGEATSMGLSAFGVTDSSGNPFDVNKLVTGKITLALQSLVGVENHKALTQRIGKANRIYQTGINMLDVTKGLFDNAQTMAEIGIEHTGQMGNALREGGVVAENAYRPMLEKVNPQNAALRKIQKFREGADAVEDAFSTVNQVFSEVVDFKENLGQLKTEKETLLKEIEEAKVEKETERQTTKDESEIKTNISPEDFAQATGTQSK